MSRAFFAGAPPRQIAHRGASGTHPENTIEAFRAARAAGAQGIELDVHRSTDGEIVVIHDGTLERTTDGRGEVRTRTLAQLQALDAGYHFSADGGRTHPFRGTGVRIPMLREVCETFPEVPMILEIKQCEPHLEQDLARILQETGAVERTLVFSLDQEPVGRYRAMGRDRPTGFGPAEVADFLRRVASGDWLGYRPDALAFAVPVRHEGTQIISAPFLEAAHRFGREVYVWTVNDPRQMHTLLDLGVDGLISDFPERLRAVIAERAVSP
ncbi:MAG: glycerophosphodiester phosphodiesterase [Gemmatimonadota bacterium]